jgi:hypothetical protein
MKETWKWALLRVPEDLDDSPGYALAGVAPRNDSRAMAAPLSIGLEWSAHEYKNYIDLVGTTSALGVAAM